MNNIRNHFYNKFLAAQSSGNVTHVIESIHNLAIRHLINHKDYNKLTVNLPTEKLYQIEYTQDLFFTLEGQSEVNSVYETCKYHLAHGELIEAARWVRQLLFRLEYKKSDNQDYNGAVTLINKINSLKNDSNPVLEIELHRINTRLDKVLKFKKEKIKLKEEGCDSRIISKSDLIKCAIETPAKDFQEATSLIDKVWQHPYFNKLFLLLALHLAEGTNFRFQLSDELNNQSFRDHIETGLNYSTLVHETYHALQKIIFSNQDFYKARTTTNEHPAPKHFTEEKFYDNVKQTYHNIIKFIDKNEEIPETATVPELIKSIKNKLPYIDLFNFCNNETLEALNQHMLNKNITFSQAKEAWLRFNLPFDVKTLNTWDDFLTTIDSHCKIIARKYGINSEQTAYVLARISYFINEKGEKEINNNNYKENGYSTELMPIVFEFMAKNLDANLMALFAPMLEYFSEYVEPEISLHMQLHMENNCQSIIENDKEQCLNNYNPFPIGQCIVDLPGFELR